MTTSILPPDELNQMIAKRMLYRRVDSLIRCAISLAADMTQLSDKLAQNGIEADINSLGEVQQRGGEIDRLCGEIYALREMRDAILPKPEMVARELGHLGGLAKTEAKAEAARENGKKGGRPKKE